MVSKEVKKYMSSIGKKGGKSATGEKKDRRLTHGADHYKKIRALRKKEKADDAED